MNHSNIDPGALGAAIIIMVVTWIAWGCVALSVGWFFGWGYCFAVLALATFLGLHVLVKAVRKELSK